MPRISPCPEHLEWREVDTQPDMQWDKPGRCVASATVKGWGQWVN